MSNLPQSDLILAGRFADGDLDASEAAQAESRMAKDADFAAAVEQIRVQSSLLGRLPKFKPSDDLADRTLQASMDQVKAIMGAWPIESDGDKASASASPKAAGKSFDWKSTAALVASLAGVFMIGAMLWQNNQLADSNVAMSEAPPMSVASHGDDDDTMDEGVGMERLPEPFAAGMQEQAKSAAKSDQMFREDDQVFSKSAPQQTAPQTAASNAIPGSDVAFSGTPMKQAPAAPGQIRNAELTNTSAPVSQIWCVSQDSTASKSSVCDILNLNQIAVQREEAPQTAQTPDAVEAFYVAATPKQMKLAMSQISNNADIEMIEIPSGANSPIADAIQQQFTQSYTVPRANAGASLDNNLPPNFQQSQALGQQLVSNWLPRGLSSPSGPVPPILESGSEIEGLQAAPSASDLASGARARKSSPAPASNAGGGGFGGAGLGGGQMEEESDAEVAMADAATTLKQQAQQAELDKYLDDSEQLRQYLILVRGGEENK